jgi:hypothetical protein
MNIDRSGRKCDVHPRPPGVFPVGEAVTQPGTAIFPWLDDAALFSAAIMDFLS